MSPEAIVRQNMMEAQACLERLVANTATMDLIAEAGKKMANSLKAGGRLISCGNGGSMCDAMHFAEELSGRFRENRPGYGAMAISDPGYLSCAANDFGYQFTFSRWVESHGRKGDVLLAISTSGKSPNVLEACRAARQLGLTVIGLTGVNQSPLRDCSDLTIVTPGGRWADRVQELHIKVIHSLIAVIESLMASN
jgi:D-sedoheptulose 7-phosphate isomerase